MVSGTAVRYATTDRGAWGNASTSNAGGCPAAAGAATVRARADKARRTHAGMTAERIAAGAASRRDQLRYTRAL